MIDEKKKNKNAGKIGRGVPTFLILFSVTVLVVIIGFVVMFLLIRVGMGYKGNQGPLPYIIGLLNVTAFTILMVFFCVNLTGLRKLQKATAEVERGERPADYGYAGDIADLIEVVIRVSARMSINSNKQNKITDDYEAFIPQKILHYCHTDLRKEIKTGVIGVVKGTRMLIKLGGYKAGTDEKQYTRYLDEISSRGGLMLSSTSEEIHAIFPDKKESELGYFDSLLKEGQMLNLRYDTYDIVLVGTQSFMYVRARPQMI